ncbi:MAG: alpha/beta hydrolase family esterase, partial [Panacagrimonas sp.]
MRLAIAATLGLSGSAWAGPSTVDTTHGFLVPTPTLAYTYPKIGSTYVRSAKGLKVYAATLTVTGSSRRYIVMRPDPAPAGAPVMLMLHPRDTSPEIMTNLTNAVDYVATQGFWAVMPQATNGVWQETASSGTQDVTFMRALIDTLAAQGADKNRVYAIGYSSGGLFVSRLACEMSDRIAAFGIVSGSTRYETLVSCAPPVHRPKQFYLGTQDPLQLYDSGRAVVQEWSRKQKCSGVVSNSLPDRANDSTTVQRDDYTGCSGTHLQLFTVYGGG